MEKGTTNFKIEMDNNPIDFDLAVVSINNYGTLGQLNSSILTKYGYDLSKVDNIDVEKGYNFFRQGKLKPILFVVSVSKNDTRINLERNLTNGINNNLKYLIGKKVWLPLMGTGAGGLDFETSYQITKNVIDKYFKEIQFVFSIPKHKKGIEFINNLDKNINIEQKLINQINHKLYLVGSSWDGNDQTQRFVNQSIWENGYDNKYLDIVNKVERGDLLLMKSTFAQNSNSILRIKAYGIVEENLNNGQKIKINWNLVDDFIDIKGLGYYRDTITIPSKVDVDSILLEIEKNNSNLINIITGLRTTTLSSKNNYDLEFEEKFKWHRFLRDVLNKEYDLNLVIETVRILNGINIKLDLADEETKSYALVLNKEKFSDVTNDSTFKAGNKDSRIMSKIYSDIGNDIDFFSSNNTLNKYFAFFDDSFTQENINDIKQWYKSFKINALKILTLADIFKLAEKNDIKYSDYTPNNLESKIEEKPENELIIDNKQDKIPFHLDQVVKEDKLGREPVAKEFVRLIKNDIFTDKLNHSFMVHLQGKWGAGKSSFLNFIKKNLNADEEEKWIVVEYNAWQNQHISPPWWSLIDQVYLKSRKQLNCKASFCLWIKETSRRIWRYSGWDKTIAFIIFLLCILCLIYFSNDILNIFNASTSSDAGNTNKFFASIGVFLKLILTSASVLGTLFTFTKFITVPFFINSSKEAKSFVLRASDPMNKIKDHFNKLVDDINSKKKKRQLAIFIDDIDRCDKEFIVQLLEGIQTLFKDKRVLYIVAGDKNWISTSFGNTYEDFATEQINKQQLGEFFIEKAFQLSFRLPNISEASKQNYWNHILGLKKEDTNIKINSVDELTEDEQHQLKEELEIAQSDLTDPSFVEELQEKYNLSEDTASNIVIEEKNKDTEKLKHLLQEYHTYIDTNPRSIIRLANNYTMARAILMTERANFNEHKLFRWLVIEDLCPNVKNTTPNVQNLSDLEDIINKNNDIIKRNSSLNLLKGDENFMEGAIEMDDIKTIKGI